MTEPTDPVTPSQLEGEQPREPRWKRAALLIAGITGIAAAASIVTLAATHNSAVAENAKAYVNGLSDGLNANARSYLEGLADGLDYD